MSKLRFSVLTPVYDTPADVTDVDPYSNPHLREEVRPVPVSNGGR